MARASGFEPETMRWQRNIFPLNYARRIIVSSLEILNTLTRFFLRHPIGTTLCLVSQKKRR